MAISSTAVQPNQSNPYAALAGSTGSSSAATSPLTLPSITTTPVTGSALTPTATSASNLLASNTPTSLTSLLAPLYSQLFGAQTGALAQTTGLQGEQGMAQAVSSSAARGLTGSSIEQSGIQSALANANMNYTQGYSSLLGNYLSNYTNAASTDVTNQSSYYNNLAQALGQSYAQTVQQNEFNTAQANGLSEANKQANATLYAGIAGGIGNALSGFSDMRLKKHVRKIGRKIGLDVYEYEYDRERAPHLGLPGGKRVGFLAHHVADLYPEAVRVVKGYLYIDYDKLAAAVA